MVTAGKRAAIYARVSTTNHGQDVGLQTRDLEDFCQRNGLTIANTYVDEGVSGRKARRPQLDRLMADAKKRAFDVVVAWKLDRFGRSVIDLHRLVKELMGYDVAFVSLRESIDLTTPAGRAFFGMMAVFAEFEADVIAERVKAGLRNTKANGTRLGRPRTKTTPELVAEIQRAKPKLARKKLTYRALGERLGVSPNTVWKLAHQDGQ